MYEILEQPKRENITINLNFIDNIEVVALP